jgi:hypothetical protein
MNHHTVIKAGLDVGSIGIIAAWWGGIVGPLATTLTVIWISYCIAEVVYKIYKHFKGKK